MLLGQTPLQQPLFSKPCSMMVKLPLSRHTKPPFPSHLPHKRTLAPLHICNAASKQVGKTEMPDNDPVDNPDYDQVVLDESYYSDMGITKEDAEAESTFKASDLDPMGEDLDLEKLFKLRRGLPQHMMQDLDKAEDKIWGPDAMLMAGFRAEEIVMARVMLDTVGAQDIKIVPCTQQTLYMPVDIALQQPEPEWENPRDPGFYGGGWGAQRTIIFSGLSLKAQATFIELLEDNGLPPICATMVTPDTSRDLVGELMAEAVKEQRGRTNKGPEPWDEADIADELEPVEKVLAEQTKERLKELADGIEDEDFDALFDEEGGEEVTLSIEDVKAAREWRKKQLQEQQQATGTAETQQDSTAQQGSTAQSTAQFQSAANQPQQAQRDVGQVSQNGVSGRTDRQTRETTGRTDRQGSKGQRDSELVVEAEFSELADSKSSDTTQASKEQQEGNVQDLSELFYAASAAKQAPPGSKSSADAFERFRDASMKQAGVNGKSSGNAVGIEKGPVDQGPSASEGVHEGAPQELDEGDFEGEWDDDEVPFDMDDAEIDAALQAEEHLLDSIASGKPMTLTELVRDLGDMGQLARKQAGLDSNTGLDSSSSGMQNTQQKEATAAESSACDSGDGSVESADNSNSSSSRDKSFDQQENDSQKGTASGSSLQSGAVDSAGPRSEAAAAESSSSQPFVINSSTSSNGKVSAKGSSAFSGPVFNGNGNGAGVKLNGSANGALRGPQGTSTGPPEATQGPTKAPQGPQAPRKAAIDVLDTGFRSEPSNKVTEDFLSPLEAFKEACNKALDAGLPYDLLIAALDEAERGGSPVLRYRPWHADGNHVDYETPTPEQPQTGQPGTTVMTRAQLREVAERNGLNYERLVADARAKGVVIPEE